MYSSLWLVVAAKHNRDTGQALTPPHASRFVEAIAEQNGSTYAIILQDQINMSGGVHRQLRLRRSEQVGIRDQRRMPPALPAS